MTVSIESLVTDVLVLGGGLSGYRAVVAAREKGARVATAFPPSVIGFNAPIAAEDPRDSAEAFFDGMERGGYGINDRPLVRMLAQQSVDADRELAAIGVPFATRDGKAAQRHLSGNLCAIGVRPGRHGRRLAAGAEGLAASAGSTTSTYPADVAADALGIALHVRARLIDMEFWMCHVSFRQDAAGIVAEQTSIN